MIADSPYGAGDFTLAPRAGAVAGVLASILMLAPATLGGPVEAILEGVGRAVFPDLWIHPGGRGALLGLGVHVAVGAILGLLYASSQRHAPPGATFMTGLVFGVMIWVGARIVSSFAFSGVRELIHSWIWFSSCLAYGAALGVMAVLSQRVRPAAHTVVLKD